VAAGGLDSDGRSGEPDRRFGWLEPKQSTEERVTIIPVYTVPPRASLIGVDRLDGLHYRRTHRYAK